MRWCWWCNEKKNKFFFSSLFFSDQNVSPPLPSFDRSECGVIVIMICCFFYIFFLARRRRLFFFLLLMCAFGNVKRKQNNTRIFYRSVADLSPYFAPPIISQSITLDFSSFFSLWFHRHRPTISCDSFCEINIFFSLSLARADVYNLFGNSFHSSFSYGSPYFFPPSSHFIPTYTKCVVAAHQEWAKKKTQHNIQETISFGHKDRRLMARVWNSRQWKRFSYRINKQQRKRVWRFAAYHMTDYGTADSRSHNKSITTLLEIIVIDDDRRRVVSSPPFFRISPTRTHFFTAIFTHQDALTMHWRAMNNQTLTFPLLFRCFDSEIHANFSTFFFVILSWPWNFPSSSVDFYAWNRRFSTLRTLHLRARHI